MSSVIKHVKPQLDEHLSQTGLRRGISKLLNGTEWGTTTSRLYRDWVEVISDYQLFRLYPFYHLFSML